MFYEKNRRGKDADAHNDSKGTFNHRIASDPLVWSREKWGTTPREVPTIMFGVSIVIVVVVAALVDASSAPSRVSVTRPTLGPNFGAQERRVNVKDGHRIDASILGGGVLADCAIDTQRGCDQLRDRR